jgi:dephospho-CoA kinase
MKIIGLVGGVGSGKSTVARMLQDLGASVIDVDKIGHEVLCLPEIITQMKSRWHGFMDHSDTVGADERHEIAKIVFEDYKELDFLEAITWTPMRRIIEEKMELFKFSSILVLDFPLLFESGLDKECDEV